MNVIEIVKEYLQKNNYDGLAGDDCGCELEDLMPCDCSYIMNCEAGHKVLVKDLTPAEIEEYEVDDCEWVMVAGKKRERGRK